MPKTPAAPPPRATDGPRRALAVPAVARLALAIALALASAAAARADDGPRPAAQTPGGDRAPAGPIGESAGGASGAAGAVTGTAAPAEPGRPKLTDLSLEELMNVETTSVSKKPQKRSEVAAALYVITREDIRRSGVQSIPDALRLAPGVNVARIDANRWAVGIRGFESQLSRDVLVLIDGRAVYSPLFAGTYWEVQDTLLEDIDRIEVIRGPGGAIYGANAVNGVINIITRSSKETVGVYAQGGAGIEEQGFANFRYGGKLDDGFTYRVYGKVFNRSSEYHTQGSNFDGWRQAQGGARADWDPTGHDLLTLQGDIYEGQAGERSDFTSFDAPFTESREGLEHLGGGNILSRYTHEFTKDSQIQLQAYYDRTERTELEFQDRRDTVDGQLVHRFPIPLPLPQDFIWGLEVRLSSGQTRSSSIDTIAFTPQTRDDPLYAAFLQDEITLAPDLLKLTLGSKFEHNSYSGYEVHPSGRLALTPIPHHLLWVAVSRTVRTPSRVEQDLRLEGATGPTTPVFVEVNGDRKFQSEELVAFEGGYRVQPIETLSLDIAGFHNRYADLLSVESGGPPTTAPIGGGATGTFLPLVFRNDLAGRAYGVEVAADWSILEWWQLHGAYSWLDIQLETVKGGTDHATEYSEERSSPHHTFAVRSYMDLPRNTELDLTFRFVDSLPAQRVGSYGTLDAHIGWRPTPIIELALFGENLVEDHHAEFPYGGSAGTIGVRRSGYAAVTVRW